MSLGRTLVIIAAFGGTVFAQTPTVAPNGVLNAASFTAAGQPGNAVAPGSLVSIFGTNFSNTLSVADSIPLSNTLNGVSVRFNNTPAPLVVVAQAQINAQLPWDVIPAGADSGTATVVVTRNGNSSEAQSMNVNRFSPGIYTVTANGVGMAIAQNGDDATLAQPEGSISGLDTRPARIGGAAIIYSNGLGPVDPPVNSGMNSLDALRRTTTMPTILIGGLPAQVLFSGLAPQFVGVNQVNVIVPDGVQPGNAVPIQIQIGGITTSDMVTIAVR